CGITSIADPASRSTFKASINPAASNHPNEPQQAFRGGRFYDGRPGYTGFHTVTPPNFPACSMPNDNGDNPEVWLMPPTSNHTGGVNAGLFDGSVRFISETIDCNGATLGQLNNGSGQSPYGVWGAYGSPNGGESKSM
ncbi:MAG: H-X9-DG-CTERM domain-containing protein, partial [Thermoguttaceae bacterium]